jgi:hypothetical protein
MPGSPLTAGVVGAALVGGLGLSDADADECPA